MCMWTLGTRADCHRLNTVTPRLLSTVLVLGRADLVNAFEHIFGVDGAQAIVSGLDPEVQAFFK